MPILLESDPLIAGALGPALGPEGTVVADSAALHQFLTGTYAHSVVVVGPSVPLDEALDLAATERLARPHLSVVLLRTRVDTSVLKNALRAGVREVLKSEDLRGLTSSC